MREFHTWYYDNVMIPYYEKIREGRGHTLHDNIPEPKAARVWSDSDMTNIGSITEAVTMEKYMQKGLLLAKLGAKTTGFTQPMDVGDGFKTKKQQAKKLIANIGDEPLQHVIKQQLNELKVKGDFLIKGYKKLDAIID